MIDSAKKEEYYDKTNIQQPACAGYGGRAAADDSMGRMSPMPVPARQPQSELINCPTDGCTVTTTDGTSFSHSDSSCPYADDSRYCSECGYLTHDTETDTYTHKDDCSLKETTQPPATCISCGKTEGNHKEICRFTCPTTGCTVTYDGTDYTHNASSCLYKDPEVYCTECGYMTYSQEDDDYYHADDCSIGKENQDKPSIGGDDAPGPD